ncbi:Beta-glucosidase 18, partial [Mucuna pruriens]
MTNHTNKMKMQLRVVMTLLCCVQFHVQSFLFGTGTSSYQMMFLFMGIFMKQQQIEGAPFEDCKGLSNSDVDIELMSSLGENTRNLPRGIYGDINPSGIMFYIKIIDNLLLRGERDIVLIVPKSEQGVLNPGIEPFVVIHHNDLPQELEERYGRDFVHIAEICFKSFGDRKIPPPGHCSPPFGNCYTANSDVEPLIVMHNMLLSHAKAVELYRKHFQATKNVLNKNPAKLLSSIKYLQQKSKEKSLLKGSLDFIGINHSGTLYAKDCSLVPLCFSFGFEDGISRSQFPEGFLFGTSTSSYQVEGAPLEDGKGVSNWDVFSHIPGKINNDENGDIADDHYHRYLEDIKLISSLGINVYRFSISWTRILPRGVYGDINPSGVMFYNKIIDNLLLKGIEPFVTIHHHDLPQEPEEKYGGWLSPLIQRDFVHFAEVCFKSFGDRVKYWATINEPNLAADMAYIRGTYPPGHCSPPFGNCYAGNSDVEPLMVMHNMLLSHAKAVELYRKHFQAKQGGTIGIIVHTFMCLDPLVFGEYPSEMRSILGSQLPVFSLKEKSLLKGSLDFIGINNYGTLYAKDCSLSACLLGADHPIRGYVETSGTRDGIPIGEPTGKDRFFVVPRGMEKIVDYIKIRYHNMPMYITENGYSSPPKPDVTMDDLLQDFKRIDYHKAYLAAVLRAIRKGADVRGYMIWSLLDNFEWTSGYDTRFGLYYVNRHTLERIPKLSVQWFSSFLNNTSHTNKQDLSEQYVTGKDEMTVGFQVI